tara:strand:- start:430 stop:762 length:333 start_codon:yes stop_codon:yes gene_type:complete
MKQNNAGSDNSCVLKQILQENADPNTIALEALHAGSVRVMTRFAQCPSADGAYAVIRLLEAIDSHEESFKPKGASSPYKSAILYWSGILKEILSQAQQRSKGSDLRVRLH